MFVYTFGVVYGAMALNQPTPNLLWHYLNNTKIAFCILSLLFGLLFLYDLFRLRKNKLINNFREQKKYKRYNKILLLLFVVGYKSFEFSMLLYKITHSLLLNTIYIVIMFLVLKPRKA